MSTRLPHARLRGLAGLAALGLLAAAGPSWAGTDAGVDPGVTFDGNDFALSLERTVGGTTMTLEPSALETAFGSARCHCPNDLVARLELSEAGLAKLKKMSRHALDAQLVVGIDCNKEATPAAQCPTIAGALTLTTDDPSTTQSLSTGELFAAANGGSAPDCDKLTAAARQLWAVIRYNGSRVAHPALAFKIGAGGAPDAPTEVTALVGEGGLLVAWKAPAKTTGIAGYQVLCAPGKNNPDAPVYESCKEAPGGAGGSGPFATLADPLVCSGLVATGSSSVRLSGLENGRAYTLAVISIRADGTPSVPSTMVMGVPGATVGFFDRYQAEGGTAQAGCALAHRPHGRGGGLAGGALGALLLLAIARRRRKLGRIAALGVAALIVMHPVAAQARTSDAPGEPSADDYESPHHWNFELRFGPYRTGVDGELASRGVDAHPFRDTFGGGRRLMTQLEIDRQILDWGGSLALGFTAGQFRATAAALTADGVTRSGDETSLLLVPLSLAVVYRATFLERRFDIPFVPFAKLGLDYTYWSVGHTGRSDTPDGGTPGWHAGAGLAMYLDFLDPDAARTLDHDAGVNHTALFLEVTRYQISGLGAAHKLRLGDTTWFAGLMLEL